MPIEDEIEALHHSDQRAVRTVDSLTDDQWAAPSLLPCWTRAHVVAHLALNAEGFAAALEGLVEGEPVPIYSSDASREADIAGLARSAYAVIRERFFAATQHFRTVAAELEPEHWTGMLRRLPEGPQWPADAMIGIRHREVEIHHADLGADYGHRDWTSAFTEQLLDQASWDHTASPDSPRFAIRAMDLNRTWSIGAEVPTVSGTAADLGWWLIGRGAGEGIVSDAGELPALGPWRRAPS